MNPEPNVALREAIQEATVARLENPQSPLLTVLLLGPTGAGKSELLNALAGARIAQSHYLRPTTTRPTIYAHASITIEQLSQYAELLGEIAAQPGAFVTHQQDALREKILIDAPDIDSFRTEHRDTLMTLLPIVDVALYVVTPFSYKDNLGWDTVLRQRGRRAFAFVINKWDAEGKPDAQPSAIQADGDLEQLLQQRTGYAQPRLFRTSARFWLTRKLGEQEPQAEPHEGDQFLQFEQWLSSGLVTSHIAQIHERRRHALWNQLGAAIAEATPPEVQWNKWRAEVKTVLESLQHDGQRAMAPYIAARANDVAEVRKLARPRSFGLLGGIMAGLSSIRRFRPPSVATTAGLALLQSEASKSVATIGNQLQNLAELRLSALGWAARKENLSVTSVQKAWAVAMSSLSSDMDNVFQLAAGAALSRKLDVGRKATAWLILGCLELAAVALIATAVWRIAKGYWQAQYVDLSFAASFLVLFVCLVGLAFATRVLIFPMSSGRIMRELDRPLYLRWREKIHSFEQTAREYMQDYSGLRAEGIAFGDICTREAERADVPLSQIEDVSTREDVRRLFATR
ncbi:MAG: GTPase [Candidatus Sumerlaeaceae bacterium]